MRDKLFYRGMTIVAAIIWVASQVHFGSDAKGIGATISNISGIAMAWGIIGDITRNIVIHKHETTNNNIDKIVFEDGKEILKGAVKEVEEEQKVSLINRLMGKKASNEQ